ncbi:matrix-remodeling-associated protein 7 isoform X2 [Anser cygnoides]|uniref:matrix-remodeling-associated protein 7 isoform X2 n=1 Tax=Anser cygnoides TaxID=8845 RepID=UPI0034D181DC
MDLYLAVPLLFTLLALVLASVFVRLRGTGGGGGGGGGERLREAGAEEPGSGAEAAEGPEAEGGRVPVEEVGAGDEGKEAASERREDKEKEKEEAAAAAAAAAERGPEAEPSPAETESIPRQPPAAEPREAGQQQQQKEEEEEAETKEEEPDSESEKLVVREPEDEDAADETFSFKYSPGKLRGNQYKSMMTKEELEEEQSFSFQASQVVQGDRAAARIELTSDLTSL